jgi:hypothetical protein
MSTRINVTVDLGGLRERNKQQVTANRFAYLERLEDERFRAAAQKAQADRLTAEGLDGQGRTLYWGMGPNGQPGQELAASRNDEGYFIIHSHWATGFLYPRFTFEYESEPMVGELGDIPGAYYIFYWNMSGTAVARLSSLYRAAHLSSPLANRPQFANTVDLGAAYKQRGSKPKKVDFKPVTDDQINFEVPLLKWLPIDGGNRSSETFYTIGKQKGQKFYVRSLFLSYSDFGQEDDRVSVARWDLIKEDEDSDLALIGVPSIGVSV